MVNEEDSMNDWILVEDRLPDWCREHLVLVMTPRRVKNKLPPITCLSKWNGEKFETSPYDGEHVTHWQPLPEPPESEE